MTKIRIGDILGFDDAEVIEIKEESTDKGKVNNDKEN